MPEMIQPGFIEPRLRSKTKASVLRDMVGLGEKTRRLLDGRALLEGLEEREALCSTALPGGVAFLHTRQHQTYLVETSFLAVGRTVQEIHYGAPDGRPTDLFFLVCCEDDRFHLHTLARLCLMAVKTDLLAGLRAASDAAAMHEILLSCEQSVIGTLPR
jgi:mannitol/fructose-specific phosphotransferase system IIA component (Ntr-type)